MLILFFNIKGKFIDKNTDFYWVFLPNDFGISKPSNYICLLNSVILEDYLDKKHFNKNILKLIDYEYDLLELLFRIVISNEIKNNINNYYIDNFIISNSNKIYPFTNLIDLKNNIELVEKLYKCINYVFNFSHNYFNLEKTSINLNKYYKSILSLLDIISNNYIVSKYYNPKFHNYRDIYSYININCNNYYIKNFIKIRDKNDKNKIYYYTVLYIYINLRV